MRYLGIDYGLSRIGLAVSDEEGKLAFPLKTIDGGEESVDRISVIIKEERITLVVIGLPSEMVGVDMSIRTAVSAFGNAIARQCSVPVEFESEMFSTKIAEVHSEKNADASAAAIILQSFLDRRNKK